MKRAGRHGLTWLLWCWAVLGSPAWAQEDGRMVRHGEYSIHYQVMSSTFLQPDIAAAYGVVRARNRSLVMVSVRRGEEFDSTPSRALVTGTRADLVHRHELSFRELEQRGAIYYIADFSHGREDLLTFRLEVQPGGAGEAAYPLEFTHTVYWEP